MSLINGCLLKYTPPNKGKVTIGGRVYPIVKIGNQWWLAENLDYSFDGSSGRYINNDQSTYGIDGTYKCGQLYYWNSVKYLDDNKSTLLPTGFRVPSRLDYSQLRNSLGQNAGTQLKATDSSITSSWPLNWNGSNSSGFNATPCGSSYNNYEFFGSRTYYWTIDEYSNTHAYSEILINDSADLIDNWNHKTMMSFYIRLVKDAT